jgi:peptidoglycan L-alanyl-D-glutamate endopeptidase CwlK
MGASVLRFGDSGASVKRLQQALLDAGFSPGAIDGQFFGGTEAAVRAFQTSEGLLADGIAGPRTQAALQLTDSDQLPDVTGQVTTAIVSRMCPSAPISNIKAHLPILLDSLRMAGMFDRIMVLISIATIRAETAAFVPVSEGLSKYNTSPNGQPFDLYDNRKDLGNRGPTDGSVYKGRGFVQLTGRSNYREYGPRLPQPVDLEAQPELANAADIAAQLLALFLGDRELQIKDALMHGNYQAARRLVNGGVHGLDDFTDAYVTGDKLLPATI